MSWSVAAAFNSMSRCCSLLAILLPQRFRMALSFEQHFCMLLVAKLTSMIGFVSEIVYLIRKRLSTTSGGLSNRFSDQDRAIPGYSPSCLFRAPCR